jgi:ketosteroid isomerase-like protein
MDATTSTNASTETDGAEIRRLIDGWAKAIRARDIDGSVFGYAPDVLTFDLVNPLQNVGVDAVRRRLEEWFSSFDGPIGFENHDLNITAGHGIAFSHSLNHVRATTKQGQEIDMFWRATACFRKLGVHWTVTHTHASVPFDMESTQASLDLKP